jgi:hypothetical protein
MSTDNWLNGPLTDKRTAYAGARVLEVMSVFNSPSWAEREIALDGWAISARRGRFGAGGSPNFFCVKTQGPTFVFIGGIQNASDAENLWANYQNVRNVDPDGTANNPFFSNLASFVYSNGIGGVWDLGSIRLFGHSAGGACWSYLKRLLDTASSPFADLSAVTYGSPRARGRGAWYGLGPDRVARYFNNDDPVALFPYDPGVWSSTMFFGGTNARARLAAFSNGVRGYQINQNGLISVADNPDAAAANRSASVEAWLSATAANAATSHSIEAYRTRLQVPDASGPSSPLLPSAGQELLSPIPSSRELDRLGDQIVATIVSDAQRQNAIPLAIPDDRLFRVRRKGKVWIVLFGEVEITYSLLKKRARGLARIGNDFLRRLQRQEIVAVEDLEAQIGQYLLLASSPNSGFTPQLNTGLPTP